MVHTCEIWCAAAFRDDHDILLLEGTLGTSELLFKTGSFLCEEDGGRFGVSKVTTCGVAQLSYEKVRTWPFRHERQFGYW